ncbi:MAG: oligosaccharide flippase family protein, partial [Veillonella sp.]|nr:oligosaccharide flippase family protein [Veillonella sp.]
MDTKIVAAAKWSVITEVLAKLITPLTNIILAHMLAPTAFGILATIMMVISFAEMLADAGFQKFLVQHEFESTQDKQEATDVAFIANLVFSLVLWGAIIIGRDELAVLVGNDGLGIPLAVMGAMIPLSAFSSVQMALYRIPMALMGYDYWSLIAGMLGSQLFTALALLKSRKNQIHLFFSSRVFMNMFNYSAWSLAEAFSIWLTAWVDTFIISRFLDAYYLGIYKMPMAIVTTVMAMATASLAPVLFAALSRVQNNQQAFSNTFFTFQRYMALFLVPLGVGLFVFQDFVVQLLLGSQWTLAGIVLGSWALSSAIMTVTANLISEIFRAKGMPNLSFWAQILHLVVLIPVIYICIQYDFSTFVYARSLVRMEMLVASMLLLALFVNMSAFRIISNISVYLITASIVGLIAYSILHLYDAVW